MFLLGRSSDKNPKAQPPGEEGSRPLGHGH